MGELSFDDFKRMARDGDLSPIEKIGFPNSYREGKERNIANDIATKVDLKKRKNQTVIDIGCGCSQLVFEIISDCKEFGHQLVLIDSKEMLDHIPDLPNVTKIEGRFPDVMTKLAGFIGKADSVICYSVLHYIFVELNYLVVLHEGASLLKSGGKLLVGDIPNTSARKRFIDSDEGQKFVKRGPSTAEKGATGHERSDQKIDDSVVMNILSRFRSFGYESYVLPQAPELPMSNRREDILIVKR